MNSRAVSLITCSLLSWSLRAWVLCASSLFASSLFPGSLTLLLGVTTAAVPALAQEHGHGHDHDEAADESDTFDKNARALASRKKRSKPVSFNKLRPTVQRWCKALEDDGRKDAVYSVVSGLAAHRLQGCSACAPFDKALAEQCRTLKGKGVPEGEETPASSNVPRLQREPSVTVIAVTSELFGAMAEDEEQAGEIFRAVERFAQALDAREGGTPGEREYLSVLTTYLRAPFSSLAAEAPAPTPASEKSSAPGEDIDDFFSN